MLEVRGLAKRYGDVTALRGVDLTVPEGRILSLLGPNGAGKTTLVSIVAGLRRPDAGAVRVDGLDVAAEPRRTRERIGLAPQDLGLYPVLKVRRNLQVFGELAGLRGRQLASRIDEVAAALGIEDLLDRLAGSLSGGQKRRLHTAIALLGRPPLLLLDEATVGADVETRAQLIDVVRDLAADGAAVVYSTHYLHEVEELGAEVAILDDGRVIARGTVDELVGTHGAAAVELAFAGPVPPLRLDQPVEVRDGVVRLRTDRPAAAVAHALDRLGPDADQVTSIEIVRPDLEAVYLSLTGRRYDPTGGRAGAEEAERVGAG